MGHIGRVNFNQDPNLGLFTIPTDEFCIVGNTIMKKDVKVIEEILKVKIVRATISDTELVGLFSTANSNGIVLPKNCKEKEVRVFKKMGLNVFVSQTKQTALGNLILVNDKGCVIPKELKKVKKQLEDCFGVEVEIGTIAGLSTLGSCAIATNKGLLAHINCTEEEMELLESVLKVDGDIGTVGFGSPFVGASVIANSKGFIVPKETTGPELQRVDEALGFIRW